METTELLRYAVEAFDRLGIRYFVTGSVAAMFYGEPRFTNDVDVVIDLPFGQIRDLCAAFPAPEFYVSEESARRAVANASQFNVIHPRSGLKLDLMVAADSEFNESRFARARDLGAIPGARVVFAAPEDIVLKKLDYYREGHSDKHVRDIAGIFRISGSRLDLDYLRDWVARLGLEEEWRSVERAWDPPRLLDEHIQS